jgi:hypothetical protein
MEASVDLRQSLDAKRGDRVLSLGKAQQIPDVGDEIAIVRTGISRRGRVCYADQLQILVKWDDGGSSSLLVGGTRFQVIRRPSSD